MGYTTEFDGHINIVPPFNRKEIESFNKFAREDHRDLTLPGVWCDWETDGDTIHWNGSEKFYNSLEWLQYLIDKRIKPDRVANGTIDCYGEDPKDIWRIVVKDNKVTRLDAVVTFTEPDILWPEENIYIGTHRRS